MRLANLPEGKAPLSLPFPLQQWLASRALIGLVFAAIAPLSQAISPREDYQGGWDLFMAWDSWIYQDISIQGYHYANDRLGHNIAFFPLFPLAVRGVMGLGQPWGLGFVPAALLVNNLAFLVALWTFYRWIHRHYSPPLARWTIALLAWSPFSLFGTVVYTEGLFLALSLGALMAFDDRRYGWAALAGALATATRVTGLALIPAFALASWQQKRGPAAWATTLASTGGILGFMVYGQIQFQEPLAFLKVQQAWNPTDQAFWGQGWLKLLSQFFLGPWNTKSGTLEDWGYGLGMAVLLGLGALLLQRRSTLGPWGNYGLGALMVGMWIMAGNALVNLAMVGGGVYGWVTQGHRLNPSQRFYSLWSLLIIFSSGRTASAERYIYAIAPLSLALAFVVSRSPRWGYGLVAFLGLLLAVYSLRFAQGQWVA